MLTARNSVNMSAAFSRTRLSHHTGRKGESPPIASFQDSVRLSKDNVKSPVELVPIENEEWSSDLNSVSSEASVHEKRAAKKRRQREKRVKQDGRSDEPSSETLSRVASTDELRLPEHLKVTEGFVESQKKDSAGCGFADQSKSETLGLAFVTNELSLSSADISECSESMSLELDGCDGENSKLEPFGSSPGGTLPDTLDPRSSITDSSGVETSSDADLERHTFSTNSSASSVKDHDIIDDAYVGCDDPGDRLPSFQWDQSEAGFSVVTKKKKAKSPQLNTEHESVSVCAEDSVSRDRNYFQKNEDDHSLNSNIDFCTVKPMSVLSLRRFDAVENNSLPFLAQNLSKNVAHDSCNCAPATVNTCSIDDTGSTCAGDTSSEMGLCQFDCDDFTAYPSKIDGNWTVVRTVRRTKSAAQNIRSETVIENGENISLGPAKCSENAAKSYCIQRDVIEKSGMKTRFQGQSRNSRFVHDRENMNVKNVLRSDERIVTHAGFAGISNHCAAMTNGANGAGGHLNRNLSQSSSVDGNFVSSGFKEHSGIPSTSNSDAKCERSSVDDSRNIPELKSVSVKSTDEKTKDVSPCHRNGSVVEKFTCAGKFDMETAVRYIEGEYQKVMKKQRKNPELVVIF